MSRSCWRLTVRSEFSAGHALRHYRGKCEAPHGHNFAVEAVVQGNVLTSDTELLLDFSLLKQDLNAVLETLDHRDLNRTPPFDRSNPSSENLARHIFRLLAPGAERRGVRLHSVTVGEKSGQSATYLEEEQPRESADVPGLRPKPRRGE
ncbi:MAG: 6-carboxytetrahydropterin synthase [Desulfovibrio sp.]|jgi:6-pyruvoyltetrahydropterin/6-carboxytetrahydropterin synthase|nr:6-carboxytetrahydropterin synthase [Desulfovibrio sp.]